MDNIFFDSWQGLLRALITTILAYTALVFFIRISGKRTLAKMNAFDFVVTVALGSCLAAVSLDKSVALAEGALVFFTLISLQFLITWSSVRYPVVQQIVGGQPVMLLYQGQPLEEAMKKERITLEAINVAARTRGITNLHDIEVVVLETTGDLTVIEKMNSELARADTLEQVKKPVQNA
jgi:uncharacterized membrane protein YcaP (DUF421 family)